MKGVDIMGDFRNQLFNIDSYYIERLNPDSHMDELQKLCEACSDYYELIEGRPVPSTASEELFNDVPEGKKPEEKLILGIYDRKHETNELIGVIDMLDGFPKEDVWYIGLYMIKPDQRSNGVGEKIFKEYVKLASSNGITSLQVGVLEDNPKAFKFWSRMGFEVVKKIEDYEIGNKITTVFAMRYEIEF